jgi:hypothetical protein
MTRLRLRRWQKWLFSLPLVFVAVSICQANERHFTYTHESGVLAPGAREVELWTTYRTGRHEYYTEMDHRAEFEIGLTNKLMTAFYLNWKDVASQDNTTTPASIKKEFEFEGISSEWKYKMTDPVANKIGSARYAEFAVGTDEVGVEGKLILDKRIGKNLFAYNFVVEPEWHRELNGGLGVPEIELENNLAFTHFVTPRFGAGLELRAHSEFTSENKPEHIALFVGPVVSYATEGWWVAFTALGQLPAIKRSVNDKDSALVLSRNTSLAIFSFGIF